MKNFVLIFTILIIFFKTETVLSDNSVFHVNNVEILKKNSKNRDMLINQAFLKGYKELLSRLLLKNDFDKLASTNLAQVKKLISYYQIQNPNKEKEESITLNIFFDRNKMHEFFFSKNILYSDVFNKEIIIFPLLFNDKDLFIYTKNYFYDNWNNDKISDELIQYTLPVESIESIQNIEKNKENIFNIDTLDFFKEYKIENKAFVIIEKKEKIAKIFLITSIGGKKLNRNIKIENSNLENSNFDDLIIKRIKDTIEDVIKSQNLIDVRTPSFLNVKIKLNKNTNLVEFNNRLENVDLIDKFFIQQMNKDYVLMKIKYLGKIDKIISKLKDQNLDLKLVEGEWQIKII